MIGSGSDDKTIKLWKATTGPRVQTLLLGAPVKDLAFNSDSRRLVSMSRDGKVTVWEAPTWRESGNLMVKEWGTASVSAFSPNGRILALGTTGGAVKSQPLTALNAHQWRRHRSSARASPGAELQAFPPIQSGYVHPREPAG